VKIPTKAELLKIAKNAGSKGELPFDEDISPGGKNGQYVFNDKAASIEERLLQL